MRGSNSDKALLDLFNKYAAAHGSDSASMTYYTESHVVLIERGVHGVRIHISGSDEDRENRSAQKNAAPFEADSLWTPVRSARKATAEGVMAFIADTKRREERPTLIKAEVQDHVQRISNLRIRF